MGQARWRTLQQGDRFGLGATGERVCAPLCTREMAQKHNGKSPLFPFFPFFPFFRFMFLFGEVDTRDGGYQSVQVRVLSLPAGDPTRVLRCRDPLPYRGRDEAPERDLFFPREVRRKSARPLVWYSRVSPSPLSFFSFRFPSALLLRVWQEKIKKKKDRAPNIHNCRKKGVTKSRRLAPPVLATPHNVF